MHVAVRPDDTNGGGLSCLLHYSTGSAFQAPVPPLEARPLAPPGKMAKPTIVPLNSFAVTVQWTPPADLYSRRTKSALALALSRGIVINEPDLPVAGYRLRYRAIPKGGGASQVAEAVDLESQELSQVWGPDAKEAILKWLVAGFSYVFQVLAFNSAGNGPWSDPSELFLMPERSDAQVGSNEGDAPVQVQRPRPGIFSASPDSVEIHWEAPCDRGATITSYDVMCSTDPEFPEEQTRFLQSDGDATSMVVTELAPNTVYYFRYRANNSVGPSAWSARTPGIATCAKPPDRPEAPVRLGESHSWRPFEVTIKWEAPECFDIPIQNYRVRASTSEGMHGAVEVPIGGETRANAISGHLPDDCAPAPTSPSQRRPGFQKGHYAVTQLRVKGLRPSTTYYFQVRAVNQIGESDWSPVSSPMRTTASPPARCGSPCFISGSRKQGLRICWPAADLYGGDLVRYDVRVSEHVMMVLAQEFRGITTQPTAAEDGPSNEQWLEATAMGTWEPGAEYFCQVRAVSSAGVGGWSESSQPMQVEAERPLRPEAPHHFDSLPRAVVVYWRPSECRGSPLTGYRLRYSTSAEMLHSTEVRGLKGTRTDFAVTGLLPRQLYYFQVCSVNAVGSSDWSPASRPVGVVQVAPTKMGAPVLLRKTATSITVGFTPPADVGTHDGRMITSYVVRYAGGSDRLVALAAPISDGGEVFEVRNAQPTGCEVRGLPPGRPFAFLVFAVNEFGEGEPSEVSDFSTDPAPPDAPDPPWTVESTSWSVCLAIKPNCDNGSPLTQLMVEVEETATGKRWSSDFFEIHNESAVDGVHFHALNRLHPGVSYRVRALATNAVGASPWSKVSEEIFTLANVPARVALPVVEEARSRDFKLRWTPPHDNGSALCDYVVQWSMDCTFEKTVHEFRSQETTIRLDGCTPGSICYARVAATNSEGRGPFSEGARIVTHPDVPLAPSLVKVVEVGPTHSRVSWLAPFDCGSTIVAFWLRYTETSTDGRPEHERDRGELLIPSRKRVCHIEPLFSLREYIYEVAAENDYGLGPYSEPSAPTRVAPPQVPTCPGQPVFVSHSTHAVVMKWNASEPMGAEVLDQLVHVCIDPAFPEGLRKEVVVAAWVDTKALEAGLGDSRPTAVSSAPAGTSPSTSVDPVAPVQEVAQSFVSGLLHRVTTDVFGEEHFWPAEPACMLEPKAAEELERARKRAALEEKRQHVRRVDTDFDAGASSGLGSFAALMDRGKIKRRTQKEGKYTLPGLEPGTSYYVRVASRNKVGLSAWSPTSEPVATDVRPPEPVPENPGVTLLRSGCTTLSFGWQRPYCWGSPVSHYMVRFAETPEGLWRDDCYEFAHKELQRETWPGIAEAAPPAPTIDKCELADQEVIMAFVEYLMVRFGTLEESWEWLDVNGSGDISKEEFIDGDVDFGPPFADFTRPEVLPQVWQLLDSDGGGEICTNEYNKLRPYMEAVQRGSAGANYQGVYCLLPSLQPAKSYHIMVRAVNRAGMSPWTVSRDNPASTQPMTPARMLPVVGVPEERSLSAVTLRWQLPCNNGDTLHRLEMRLSRAHDVEDGIPSKEVVRDGRVIQMELDKEGVLPLELHVSDMLPGQCVFAIMRAFNSKGGCREWSAVPGPKGGVDDLWDWSCSTLPTVPDVPTSVCFDEDSLSSTESVSSGTLSFEVGRTNGRPCISFSFQIVDHDGDLVQEWETPCTLEESAAVRLHQARVRRPFTSLAPGQNYAVRARAVNAAGASEWSPLSVLTRMPPDVPQTPDAPLSEFTSPTYIEVKWHPPHHNGAMILKYGIRMSLNESAPLSEWTNLDEQMLARNTRQHGSDGRRTTLRDKGALLCRVNELQSGVAYYFTVRAYNSVGWSHWSEISRFVTRPAKPIKLNVMSGLSSAAAGHRAHEIRWQEISSDSMGFDRFDLVCGSNVRVLRWAQVASMLLCTTVDMQRLFGCKIQEGVELGDSVGGETRNELFCEDLLYTPLPPTATNFRLEHMLPGQEYFLMIRAVSAMGRGEFSDVLGPLRTAPEPPDRIEPLQVATITELSCRFQFFLPYNMGSTITTVRVVVVRAGGPLSADEMSVEPGKCKDDIARRDLFLDLAQLPIVQRPSPSERRWMHGSTTAVAQACQSEGIDEMTLMRSEHTPNYEKCTGLVYEVLVENLRPGTSYQANWACSNAVGWSPTSSTVSFLTKATVPDVPPPMVIPSL